MSGAGGRLGPARPEPGSAAGRERRERVRPAPAGRRQLVGHALRHEQPRRHRARRVRSGHLQRGLHGRRRTPRSGDPKALAWTALRHRGRGPDQEGTEQDPHRGRGIRERGAGPSDAGVEHGRSRAGDRDRRRCRSRGRRAGSPRRPLAGTRPPFPRRSARPTNRASEPERYTPCSRRAASVSGRPRSRISSLRTLDRVRDTVEGCPTGTEVKRQPGGARVLVSRLADRSRVQEPAPVT